MRLTQETGARIGELAGQILDGTPARDLPVESARLVAAFDWRALQRWNIDAARLPSARQVLYKEPTLWESYRGYILGTLMVVAAQLGLIAGLLTQALRRRRAEATIRAREQTIRTNFDRIRLLAAQLIDSQETTRAEIARDLHDGVCQELAAVSIALSGLKRASGRVQDPDAQQRLVTLQEQMHTLYDGVRRISHDLHPSTLRLLGLMTALKAHCGELERLHKVHITLIAEGDLGTVPSNVSLSLFRIAQEALRNAVVHGKSRALEVSLAKHDGVVELTISDDGNGFDVDAVRASGRGLGLVSIEERARMIGGTADMTSTPGQGTTVSVRAPLPEITRGLLKRA
jgi:two-component system sensor histidine kinase UhpB